MLPCGNGAFRGGGNDDVCGKLKPSRESPGLCYQVQVIARASSIGCVDSLSIKTVTRCQPWGLDSNRLFFESLEAPSICPPNAGVAQGTTRSYIPCMQQHGQRAAIFISRRALRLRLAALRAALLRSPNF